MTTMTDEARAALDAIRQEFPDWDITFLPGPRPHWYAWRVFDGPAALVSIDCLSARALRARLIPNTWIITPPGSPGFWP